MSQDILINLHKSDADNESWNKDSFEENSYDISFYENLIKSLKEIPGFTELRIYDKVDIEPRYILCAAYGDTVKPSEFPKTRKYKTIGFLNKKIEGIAVYQKNVDEEAKLRESDGKRFCSYSRLEPDGSRSRVSIPDD